MNLPAECPRPVDSTCIDRCPDTFRAPAERAEPSSDVPVIRHLGWNKVGNDFVYCTGDKVLSCMAENLPYRIDEALSGSFCRFEGADCTPEKAVETMFEFMQISPEINNLLLAAFLLGCLRQCFVDAEAYPKCAVYLVGPTQSRKTMVSLLGSRFIRRLGEDRSNDSKAKPANYIRNASTDYAMAENVDAVNDVAFILDDLYREGDHRTRRGMEGAVTRMVRDAADHAAKKSKNSSFEPNCQLLVTAEYVIENASTLGRTLMLRVGYPPEEGGSGGEPYFDGMQMQKVRCHADRIPVFYENFLTWFSGRYSSAVEQIRRALPGSRTDNGIMSRAYEECWLLRTAFQFFLEYVEFLHVKISKENLLSDFDRNRHRILKEQEILLRTLAGRENKNVNYSAIFLELFNNRLLDDLSGEDFYEHKENIRIRAALLCDKISSHYGFGVTEKELTKYYRERGVLRTYSNGSNKRDKRGRLLELNRARLREDAEIAWIDKILF